NYNLEKHIEEIRSLYRSRRDLVLKCIGEFFPGEVIYTHPAGGFFVWMELRPEIDSSELLHEAAKNIKVVFLPGAPFFAGNASSNFLRLSYSFITGDKIQEGLRRLGGLVSSKYQGNL
ncbi:MAG: aminotransferase class I/II-fold pyridoxal phosphate-dependent enzyme, partial [Treponema sp.]|nr:aminotransferase class I/II-fold pyridoxal phosphate-dependent enzyme [Treponema sp.]